MGKLLIQFLLECFQNTLIKQRKAKELYKRIVLHLAQASQLILCRTITASGPLPLPGLEIANGGYLLLLQIFVPQNSKLII